MPKVNGILETGIYVEDVKRSSEFYKKIFKFEVMASDERFCAMKIQKGQVFLIFKKGGTLQPVETPGGILPGHDGDGQMHFAFAISKESLSEWENWLRENGIPVESKVHWQGRGISLYFRDPDGHLIELATPGVWVNY